jgi:hypothetical protein
MPHKFVSGCAHPVPANPAFHDENLRWQAFRQAKKSFSAKKPPNKRSDEQSYGAAHAQPSGAPEIAALDQARPSFHTS